MERNNLYGYKPSIPAAAIFIILFAVTTLYHGYQLTKARCWYFIPFVVGGVCTYEPYHFIFRRGRKFTRRKTVQVIGYICRLIGHNNLASIPIYSMQSLLILLAPPLYAASVYMVLGRTVTHLNAENLSLVPVKWMTKIFVAGDVFSFLLQSAGKCSNLIAETLTTPSESTH